MIPHGVEVFVCLEPIDLRWSFDRLSNVALERIGRDARSGALVVFFGRRQDALKVLFYDGTGMCLFYNQPSSHYTSFSSNCESWFRTAACDAPPDLRPDQTAARMALPPETWGHDLPTVGALRRTRCRDAARALPGVTCRKSHPQREWRGARRHLRYHQI